MSKCLWSYCNVAVQCSHSNFLRTAISIALSFHLTHSEGVLLVQRSGAVGFGNSWFVPEDAVHEEPRWVEYDEDEET